MSKLISSDLIRLRLGAVDSSHPADQKWPIMRILRDWHLVPSTLQGRTICIFGRRALQRIFPCQCCTQGSLEKGKLESCSAAVAQRSRALTIPQTTLKSCWPSSTSLGSCIGRVISTHGIGNLNITGESSKLLNAPRTYLDASKILFCRHIDRTFFPSIRRKHRVNGIYIGSQKVDMEKRDLAQARLKRVRKRSASKNTSTRRMEGKKVREGSLEQGGGRKNNFQKKKKGGGRLRYLE